MSRARKALAKRLRRFESRSILAQESMSKFSFGGCDYARKIRLMRGCGHLSPSGLRVLNDLFSERAT